MLDFVYFVEMITKYYKFSTNYRNFPQFQTEKRHRCQPSPNPPPPPPPPNVHMTFSWTILICDASLKLTNNQRLKLAEILRISLNYSCDPFQ